MIKLKLHTILKIWLTEWSTAAKCEPKTTATVYGLCPMFFCMYQGYILTSEIDGTIQMKSYLSGNPEIRLALNEDLRIGERGGSSHGRFIICKITIQLCSA